MFILEVDLHYKLIPFMTEKPKRLMLGPMRKNVSFCSILFFFNKGIATKWQQICQTRNWKS